MIKFLQRGFAQYKGRTDGLRGIITLTLLCLTLAPYQIKAQSAKPVTINFNSEQLDVAIKMLQEKSGIPFAYNAKSLMTQKAPVVNFSAQPLNTILDQLLNNTGHSYKIVDGKVIIMPDPKSPNASAGQGPGTLKGRIVEFESSQPLPGASVYIVELQKGMQSNNDGYYQFTNIPAGKYTLKVTYISYTTETVQVEVKADKETFDIKMRGSNSLSEVVVSGTRKSRAPVSHTTERQILTEIKNSQSVVSGISSEQISKSADRNAAEVVRKIAGVTIRDDKFIIIRGMNERYNLTYLNNNIAPSTELYSRAFSLDLIPSRIIDRILVYKSAAPDLLGDMTGGAVKIFTKDAKNVKHFDIEFQTGYRENTTFNKNFLTYQGGKFDFLGFDDGTRKLPSSVPGFGDFTKATLSQKQYAQDFSNILNYGKKTALPLMQLTANYYNGFKVAGKTLSILSSLSYKNEPVHLDIDRTQGNLTYPATPELTSGTKLSRISNESQNTETAQLSLLQNFTYSLRDSSKLYFKNFVLQQGQSSTILRNSRTDQFYMDGIWQEPRNTAGNETNRKLRDIILSYSQRFLYSGNVGGSHYFGKAGKQNLEWNTGYTYSKLDIPDQRAIHLQNNIQNDGRFAGGGNYEQSWVPVFRSEEVGEGMGNALDLGHISRVWIRNNEKVYNGSADYTYKFKPWITLKAGTYQQWKERVVFRRVYTVNEGDLNSSGYYPNSSSAAIGAGVPNMDYNVVFWHQQDLDKLWSTEYLRDDKTGLKVFDRTSGSDAYTATEQNNSGYLAASLLPFDGKLDIYGGLRVEYNRQKVAGAIAPGTNNIGGVNAPVLADLKSTEFLPSLNIGYRPNTDFVFRAAYGRTINRPEFRELSPYSELDYINNQTVRGNSDLMFATVNNYDLRMEWYPKANAKGESISLGGFYKQINNPIERIIYRDLFIAGPSTISFINADKARVYGAEIDIRKNLDFIPFKFFRDLSIIANGSYIYSKATRVKRDAGITGSGTQYDPAIDRQLQGQAPYSANVGLYYENAGAGTKLSLTYNQIGPRIYAASVGRPATAASGTVTAYPGDQASLIELTRKQLDFSLSQRIVKSLQAKLSIQNLLNNAVQMAEDANFTYKYEKAKISYPAPLPGSPAIARFDGDLLSSDYKPGRFFLLTFTYGF
ncbi:TonB-dependent receptor [Mucilaginibacter sp.]|uniref:TonB-dependent receptor n=1 Tax=Mucilaginibacter sp. TaxID=1882438 RepID=UPI000CB724EA|nr:TonB-dependent receptor [Mucilaginibacter sp.]PLW88507.1 MAG: TonB-dependent receptor [Mucilaginibacter sp.]PMP66212.1 MAG: TonB-dependent receptor [Mucilaginibacter sp.]HEK22192.1 TonB-dependent receptor [Bacteroidota bacterium]